MEEMETILKSKKIDIHKKHIIAKTINLHMITKFVTNYILLVFYKQNELQYMRFLKKIYQSILSNDFKSFDSENYRILLTKLKLETNEASMQPAMDEEVDEIKSAIDTLMIN